MTCTVRGLCLLGASLALLAVPGSLEGEDPAPVTREDYEKLQTDLEEMRRELGELKQRGLAGLALEDPRHGDQNFPGQDPEGSDGAEVGSVGGISGRPALYGLANRTYVGGYFDVEFRNVHGQDHEFRFHRFVPFFYADLHERIKFAAEVEIEDGSDVSVEFAYLDLLFTDEVNFRGGVILDPLGWFNLYHDSPINNFTDRPLVNRFVIPTTLREIGAGLFGTLTSDTSEWNVTYEAYVTSGFKGLDNTGATAISRSKGVRDARASTDALGTRKFGDVGDDFSGVGRLAISPAIGTEVGLSSHIGTYDQAGDNFLWIPAIDGSYTLGQFSAGDVPVGPIQFRGEGALNIIERNTFARASGVPDDMWGYYVEANYRFLPEFFLPEGVRFTSGAFPDSVFTLSGRWGQVDLDGNRLNRFTFGFNFRPIEATVFKLDYQINNGSGRAPSNADDDAFLLSLASYF